MKNILTVEKFSKINDFVRDALNKPFCVIAIGKFLHSL